MLWALVQKYHFSNETKLFDYVVMITAINAQIELSVPNLLHGMILRSTVDVQELYISVHSVKTNNIISWTHRNTADQDWGFRQLFCTGWQELEYFFHERSEYWYRRNEMK